MHRWIVIQDILLTVVLCNIRYTTDGNIVIIRCVCFQTVCDLTTPIYTTLYVWIEIREEFSGFVLRQLPFSLVYSIQSDISLTWRNTVIRLRKAENVCKAPIFSSIIHNVAAVSCRDTHIHILYFAEKMFVLDLAAQVSACNFNYFIM